jgi:chlorophyllide a reductase subunit Z
VRHFLEDELGLPCHFAVARKPGAKTDNEAVRAGSRPDRRSCSSAATTSACTWPSSAAAVTVQADVHPGVSFPGAIIRRAHRHAFHGLRRRDLPRAGVLQRALRCAVPHPARWAPELDRIEATPRARPARPLPWDDEAQALLDRLVQAEPVLVQHLGGQAVCATAPSARPGAPARTASRPAACTPRTPRCARG